MSFLKKNTLIGILSHLKGFRSYFLQIKKLMFLFVKIEIIKDPGIVIIYFL